MGVAFHFVFKEDNTYEMRMIFKTSNRDINSIASEIAKSMKELNLIGAFDKAGFGIANGFAIVNFQLTYAGKDDHEYLKDIQNLAKVAAVTSVKLAA